MSSAPYYDRHTSRVHGIEFDGRYVMAGYELNTYLIDTKEEKSVIVNDVSCLHSRHVLDASLSGCTVTISQTTAFSRF